MANETIDSITGIWGSSSNDVYAVGYNYYDYTKCFHYGSGITLRYDGFAWHKIRSGCGVHPTATWGNTGTDVFTVGAVYPHFSFIDHYNGNTWAGMDTGTPEYLYLHGIWGSSGSDVFAVGDYGAILHFSGITFTNIIYLPHITKN
jgi:hypothetical protein